MEGVVIYFARQFVLLLNFVLSSSCSYERPLFGGGFLTPYPRSTHDDETDKK